MLLVLFKHLSNNDSKILNNFVLIKTIPMKKCSNNICNIFVHLESHSETEVYPKYQLANYGEEIYLVCHKKVSQNVKWMFQGFYPPKNANTWNVDISEDWLYIEEVHPEHEGSYWCIVDGEEYSYNYNNESTIPPLNEAILEVGGIYEYMNTS